MQFCGRPTLDKFIGSFSILFYSLLVIAIVTVPGGIGVSSQKFGIFTAGHDLKSLALNLASLLLFVLPIAVFFKSEYWQELCAVVAGSILLSLLVPPVGWRRPHPYSDDPTNLPYPRKSE